MRRGTHFFSPWSEPLNSSWSPGFGPESAYCQNVVNLCARAPPGSVQVAVDRVAGSVHGERALTTTPRGACRYWMRSARSIAGSWPRTRRCCPCTSSTSPSSCRSLKVVCSATAAARARKCQVELHSPGYLHHQRPTRTSG